MKREPQQYREINKLEDIKHNMYEDIINLPHHVSKKHPPMSNYDRAAQFASFAALRGHSDAIDETARITDYKIELDEYEIEIINQRLLELEQHNGETEIKVTYYIPDKKKTGGAYITTIGLLKKIDKYKHCLVMSDSACINIDDIIYIE